MLVAVISAAALVVGVKRGEVGGVCSHDSVGVLRAAFPAFFFIPDVIGCGAKLVSLLIEGLCKAFYYSVVDGDVLL